MKTVCNVLLVFFFFKQKKAYEMDGGLEFRRVLFRSRDGGGAGELVVERGDACVVRRDLGEGVLHDREGRVLTDRSEERRVGKECRSRWSPDDLKKKSEKMQTFEPSVDVIECDCHTR